ncbi:MAG TPA: hypothetical protein VK028_03860, partial [Micromonosporaceae bacterium]|nr:hypothetical protein [Micromonosporaceae bacterium]
GRDGSWLSIGRPHPEHGFVELAALPRFDERWRYDPDAVRRYRDQMAEEQFAFLRLDMPEEDVAIRTILLTGSGTPAWHRAGTGWRLESTAGGPDGASVISQRHVIERSATSPATAALRLRGRLAPSAMPEITEINPIPPVRTRTSRRAAGGRLILRSAEVGAEAVVTVTTEGIVTSEGTMTTQGTMASEGSMATGGSMRGDRHGGWRVGRGEATLALPLPAASQIVVSVSVRLSLGWA